MQPVVCKGRFIFIKWPNDIISCHVAREKKKNSKNGKFTAQHFREFSSVFVGVWFTWKYVINNYNEIHHLCWHIVEVHERARESASSSGPEGVKHVRVGLPSGNTKTLELKQRAAHSTPIFFLQKLPASPDGEYLFHNCEDIHSCIHSKCSCWTVFFLQQIQKLESDFLPHLILFAFVRFDFYHSRNKLHVSQSTNYEYPFRNYINGDCHTSISCKVGVRRPTETMKYSDVCAQCSFICCSSAHSCLHEHELQLLCLFWMCVCHQMWWLWRQLAKKSQSNKINCMDLWGQLDRRPFTMSIYGKKNYSFPRFFRPSFCTIYSHSVSHQFNSAHQYA